MVVCKNISNSTKNAIFKDNHIRAIYLQFIEEAKRHPFLTVSEELELGKLITNCNKKYSKIFEKANKEFANKTNELSKEELIEIHLVAYAKKNKLKSSWLKQARIEIKKRSEALKRIISSHTLIVIKIAHTYLNKPSSSLFLDLISEGNLGLVTAAEKFDPKLGYKFSTYATFWIKNFISIKARSQLKPDFYIPNRLREKLSFYIKQKNEFRRKFGHWPSDRELSKYCGLKEKEIVKLKELANYKTTSLNKSVDHDTDKSREYEEVIADQKNKTPEQIYEEINLKEIINKIINHLSEREKKVLILRYGLFNNEIHALKKIGKILNISGEAVRLIEMKIKNLIIKQYPELKFFLKAA